MAQPMRKEEYEDEQLEVRLFCPDCGQEFEKRMVSRAEMEAKAVELPDREAMSLANANIAAPINAAVALNALSDNSIAYANATQTAPITQST